MASEKIMTTIKEAAEHTGLSYYFIRRLCMTNQITYARSGSKYYINLPKLVEYLNVGQSGESSGVS